MNKTGVYFDHAATSQVRPLAAEQLMQKLQLVGNPAALHRAGQRARAQLEEAREQLADAMGAQPAEVIFTSGGSESDSLAVLGGWGASGRPRCLVSAIEHPAVLGAVERGAEVLPVTAAGVVDADAAGLLIDDRTGLVSVQLVNNETGIIQPIDDLRRLAHASGAWFHTDAVQAVGNIPVSFRDSGVDMMTISAHKLGGPVGIGALIARKEIEPHPIGLGGGQERKVRSGTATVALAASFAAAVAEAVEDLAREAERLRALQRRIVERLQGFGARANTVEADHAPHIVNATFPGLRAGDLLFLLDQRDVYASVGSACRAGVHQPSEVLLAMGRSDDEAAASLRFSMGWSTTDEDVDRLLAALDECVESARLAF